MPSSNSSMIYLYFNSLKLAGKSVPYTVSAVNITANKVVTFQTQSCAGPVNLTIGSSTL